MVRARAASSRTTARRRRRSRLRTTAPPTRRPTAYATRGGRSSPTRAHVTESTPRRQRVPAASARKDARSRTRQIRPTGGRGLSTDDAVLRRDRRGCASGGGIRASSSASGCSAGTSSSRMASSNARAEGGPVGRRGTAAGESVSGQARCDSLRSRFERKQSADTPHTWADPGSPGDCSTASARSRVAACGRHPEDPCDG